jgi:protein ImuB
VVDERGTLSAPPARFVFSDLLEHEIVAWAGPWPVEERWWDPGSSGRIDRFQVVDDDGTAWLLAAQGESWWAEARYD